MKLGAHTSGRVILLEEVEDEVFSQKILGDGMAIEPDGNKLVAPCDGVVESIFDTKHAINLLSDDGVEIMLHIGIDTVELKGEHFNSEVKSGRRVHKGELLVTFDKEAIENKGYKVTTPMIICNSDKYSKINILSKGRVKQAEDVIEIE